jgi:MFS family permease
MHPDTPSPPSIDPPQRPVRVTVASLAIGQILCWAFLYYGFSSLVLPMHETLGWSRQVLMGAFTCGLVTWGLGSYAVGAAIDRGHGRLVLTAGAALAGAGMLLWSRVESPAALYAVWVLLGASMSMTLYEPAFIVLTKRYPEDYRRGITALTLVAGFGSTLSFPAVTWLASTFGWRAALVAMGVVLLLGVAPLHAWALAGPSTGRAAQAAPQASRAGDATLRMAMRQRAFWLMTAAFAAYGFAAGALWSHMMSILAALGRTPAQAVAVVVWIGPAQVLARLLHFAFARALSPWHLGLVLLAGLPAALVLLAHAAHPAAFIAFALLFGVVNGLITIVRGIIVPACWGRTHVGRISGVMSAFFVLSLASAPLGAAWVLLAVPGYRELLYALAVLGIAAFAALLAARPPSREQASAAGGVG